MVPKPRIPRMLDDSPALGSWPGPGGSRQAESGGGTGRLTSRGPSQGINLHSQGDHIKRGIRQAVCPWRVGWGRWDVYTRRSTM